MSASPADLHLLHDPAVDDLADELGDDLRSRVKSELEPGERLLWAGRSWPQPLRFVGGYLYAIGIAFFLLTAGLGGIVYELHPTRFQANTGAPTGLGTLSCIAAFFLFIGIVTAWSSAFYQRQRDCQTCYAVTDRRAISWIPEGNEHAIRVRTLHRGEIHHVERVERPDGSGTIEFGRRAEESGIFPLYAFKQIHDVRRVEQIVRGNLFAGNDS